MPKSQVTRVSTARAEAVRAPITKPRADHTSEKSLDNAIRLLNSAPMLHRELALFGVPVLKELCKIRNVSVTPTGKKGGTVRGDYVKALYAYVSFLVRAKRATGFQTYPFLF
jgi:hypothetical protein